MHTLPVRSFLQTWPKKKWQSSSLVATVACAKLVLHGDDAVGSGMCKTGSPSVDAISAEMDHKDIFVGDEAQSKRRKCSRLDELDIIPELREWLESVFFTPSEITILRIDRLIALS